MAVVVLQFDEIKKKVAVVVLQFDEIKKKWQL